MSGELRSRNVSFSYGSRRVLDEITLAAAPGTFTAIIGPNGSGKTTLLKNLLRLLEPESGIIMLGEKEIHRLSRREFARRAGSVPQNPALDYEYTVEQTVIMGRYPHLTRFQQLSSRDRDIALDAMRRADILHLKDQLITEISGGEAQRVIIARALTQEPGILALDEPTNHLDIHHQVAILGLLKGLCREKKIAVIAILHDLNFSYSYADQVVLLEDGRIHGIGSPEEVLTVAAIQEVYGVTAAIASNPFSGTPHIIYRID